jgi:peptidyl-tRNA hydrolase, PTH1 family
VKLIVGLGNPGVAYRTTRHNVGYLVIDRLLEHAGQGPLQSIKNLYTLSAFELLGNPITVAKPNLFMNESGRAVRSLISATGLESQSCLIVVDDTALPIGRIRFRMRGSSGGHNGLQSIIHALGTEEFPRLRIGIGQPEGKSSELADFVLDSFTKDEVKLLSLELDRARDACLEWVQTTGERVMQRYNG